MHVSSQALDTCAPREAVRPLLWEKAKQLFGWAKRKALGLGKLGRLKPKPKPPG
jgi:hypothetical protein